MPKKGGKGKIIMNNVVLMGRLTKDPEVRYVQGQNGQFASARYNLAVQRPGVKDKTDFITCTAMGKNGEFAEKYLKKGTLICVVGHIETGSYTNKEGNTVYTTEVRVDRHEFVPGQGGNSNTSNSSNQDSAPATQDAPANSDGFMDVPDEDELPFN